LLLYPLLPSKDTSYTTESIMCISIGQSAQIWVLHQSTWSYGEIAKFTGIPKTTVGREVCRLVALNGNYEAPHGYKGRELLMSPRKVRRAK